MTIANCKLQIDRKRLRKRRPTDRYRYVRWRWHVLFTIVDRLGEWFYACLTLLVRNRCRQQRLNDSQHSILLVQLDHLGDAVITTAILPALRQRFPRSRIEVLATPWNREVFEACPEIDAIHVSRVNRFAPRWQPFWPLALIAWGLRLRSKRFDLGIDLRGEMPLAAILWLAGVRRRVGWHCGGGGFLLTDSATFVPGRAEMQSRLALLELIGIEAPLELKDKAPWFTPPAAARADVSRRLDRCSDPSEPTERDRSEPLIVLHIGAGTAAKRWPSERWRELLGRLIVEYGPRVVLIGGPKDRILATELLDGKRWPGVEDWTGELTIAESAALIERADLMIGADSGPVHLAAAVGTPAVVLFSGTNRVRQWRPWAKQIRIVKHFVECSPCHRTECPLADHPCMRGISPETVMRYVRGALGEAELERVQGSGFRNCLTAEPTARARLGYSRDNDTFITTS